MLTLQLPSCQSFSHQHIAPAAAFRITSPSRLCSLKPERRASPAVQRRYRHCVNAAQNGFSTDEPHAQLATAKLPKTTDTQRFRNELYQWANSLTTTSGKQMPFSLPLRITQNKTGFEIAFLRTKNGVFVSEGYLVASVEEEEGVGPVLFMRFHEGDIKPKQENPQERLKTSIARIVDLPILMNQFPPIIRQISQRCS
ncbi:hypothetical protein WJX73_008021 [Symbiochloris irregularis]|uniref:DUF7148 domain-containing protein n=1 Tax=Symbiochloris irregularis TaxID=706552 RepID=A0AAW1PYX6_9CHLO